MAKAKKRNGANGSLMAALMQRAHFSATRGAEYKRGAQITWNNKYKAIHNLANGSDFLSFGGAFLDIPVGELKNVEKHNTFGNVLLDIICNGVYMNSYYEIITENPVCSAEVRAKICNDAKVLIIPGRMLMEIERGFAPYFFLGTDEGEEHLTFYRISLPNFQKPTLEWIRQMHRSFRSLAHTGGGFAEPDKGPSTAVVQNA